EDAPLLAQRVIGHLVSAGVILPATTPEAAYGKQGGYPLGPKIRELYSPPPQTFPFWKCVPSGIEVTTTKWVNEFGLTCLEEIHCPECHTRFPDGHPTWDQLTDALGQFYQSDATPTIHCPQCGKHVVVFDWAKKPHLGFSHLAFTFWNWPALDSPNWKMDLPGTIS